LKMMRRMGGMKAMQGLLGGMGGALPGGLPGGKRR